jgi:hypothetical protein
MGLITDEKTAKRKARVAISDIVSYNEAEIKKGLEEDNLFEALEEQLKEAKDHYESIVDPELEKRCNFFNLAIADILFKQRGGTIESKIW